MCKDGGEGMTAYLRAKATHCRELADIANNRELRQLLDELAGELEEEAARIESRLDQAAD